jgi:hypothetical protein
MNAPGSFYVVNQDCMTCGYPHVLAPDPMAWEMNSEGREAHCYFCKQLETSQEIEQAVNAVNISLAEPKDFLLFSRYIPSIF